MTSLSIRTLTVGDACSLYGVVLDGEDCEAETFLGNLSTRPQAQFQARIERLTTVGFLRSPDEMRGLQIPGEPTVHEIKVRSGYRLYVVRHGGHWAATHGAQKPKERRVKAEVVKARQIVEAGSQ